MKYCDQFHQIIFLTSLCGMNLVLGSTFNDTKTLHTNLFAGYNKNIRPVANQSSAVQIRVKAFLKSIQNFNEVNGEFTFVGALLVTWQDVNLKWDPLAYGGVTDITITFMDIWTPGLLLFTPAESVDSLGKKWNVLRLSSTGLVSWLPVDLIKSTCSVNVRFYPFDDQECETTFKAVGYGSHDLNIHPVSNKIDDSVYPGNQEWDIEDTEVFGPGDDSITLIFYLKRKPSFVIVNVILPILFLGLLNIMVFLLVPESGERVSYAVTVLLSISVFMTIVSDMLPQSSDPLPNLCYKLMIDMIISSLVLLVAILNLKLYHTEDTVHVPVWVQSIYRLLSFSKKRAHVRPFLEHHDIVKYVDIDQSTPDVNTATRHESDIKPTDIQLKPLAQGMVDKGDKRITWRMVSGLIDKIALTLFTTALLGTFCFFIIITTTRPKS